MGGGNRLFDTRGDPGAVGIYYILSEQTDPFSSRFLPLRLSISVLGKLYMLPLLPEKASCDFEILCIYPSLILKLPAPVATS